MWDQIIHLYTFTIIKIKTLYTFILIQFIFNSYLKQTLDRYVESDYSLVYFHHGLNSSNKPNFSWLVDAYREFDRK